MLDWIIRCIRLTVVRIDNHCNACTSHMALACTCAYACACTCGFLYHISGKEPVLQFLHYILTIGYSHCCLHGSCIILLLYQLLPNYSNHLWSPLPHSNVPHNNKLWGLHVDWVLSLLLALSASLLLSWPLQLADAQTTPEQRDKMMWVAASNPMALWNDFTQAGFFILLKCN